MCDFDTKGRVSGFRNLTCRLSRMSFIVIEISSVVTIQTINLNVFETLAVPVLSSIEWYFVKCHVLIFENIHGVGW